MLYEIAPNLPTLTTKFALSFEQVSSVLFGIDQMEYLQKALTAADGIYLKVEVKDTTVGTVTNADVDFQLSIPANAQTLVFSFMGMKTREVPVYGMGYTDR